MKHIIKPGLFIFSYRKERAEAVRFLMENGADPNPLYPGGNRFVIKLAVLLHMV